MSKKIYDFRSDTVTRPTPEMRKLMASAEVGDDVYQDDPTVNALQDKAAAMLGKPAGLFISSGTMGNLLAALVSCRRGEEMIMGTQGHTFLHEAGGVSALGGIVIHTIPNEADGSLSLENLRAAVRSDDIHEPPSRMVIIENTQNACGGMPLSLEYTKQVMAFARKHKLFMHIDGARIFNASVKLGVPAKKLVAPANSVTFCLSKGLCCPVGSVLLGEKDFIEKARRLRKMIGGGMRQAGILAAAGIYALDHMIDRLAEDHALATELANGLASFKGISLDLGSPYTNMVFIKLDESLPFDAFKLVALLKEQGILVNETGARKLRFVTHHDVDKAAVEACLKALKKILKA